MSDFKDTLKALGTPFLPHQVKQRAAGFGNKKLDYIDWVAVVDRLNEVSPTWSTFSRLEHFSIAGVNDKGKPQYVAVVQVGLDVEGVTRYGYGADVDTDPDKVVKTALAEGTKKAGNQFGIGTELWDADHRDMIDLVRTENIASLKQMVSDLVPDFDKAKDKPAAIRKHFALDDTADLNDADLLYSLLNKD